MGHSRTKIYIISISCGVHILILLLLFKFYNTGTHDWDFAEFKDQSAIDTPETIFYESPQTSSPQPVQPEQPAPQPEDQTWAELRPQAGTLGDSMEMPDDPGVESGDSENDISSDVQDSALESFDPSFAKASEGRQAEEQSKDPFVVSDAEGIVSNHTETSPSKQAQARKALAGITKGYLEQLTQEGNNLIKTIGGDPHKMPTAEQLKYERYLAKIQWCLQNAHDINRGKCENHHSIQATIKMHFKISRAGTMSDLRIVQSSGDQFVDKYIFSLFQYASSSFPPLPAYIKEDPYPLLYTVMVNWNMNQTFSMGLNRH